MYANLGALAFLIAACYMIYCWDHRLNPNLKFKTSSNWSYLVLTVLIIFVIWDILWNICSGAMSRFTSQAFLQSSFRFAWKPFFDAISTGVSEETFRYLSIVTLLECLKETKHQVTFVVIISAMIFGAFHLLNVMDEPFIAAISQVIMAFVSGLVWAIIYLYTGKLWAMMIIHGIYDYFMFLQPIGISTSNSIFIIYCVIEVIIPILLTIWMLTGKRYKVLQANARRIMLRQNFSF
ncbi:hypothetical protein IMAU30143_00832 [Lactobacillus helveticus]|uniref:CPBP family intramembrane glutamic endopeptidase n=1 Tax=Lactobacillus helveticus TaxID=1587 RepID=UPI001561C202|nr:CPBP family intramembrane glutamic endopeptidase [Lactobacillus helveticus]NRO30623.1 hypothetical protein [Lactobacillus helveticus]